MREKFIDVHSGLSVEAQPFDEMILGGPVWRLIVDGVCPNGTMLHREIARARTGGVRLIWCRLHADAAFGTVLRAAGFRWIERLVTFSRPVSAAREPVDGVEFARSEDSDSCARIAAAAFRFDRYHADPQISDEIAERFKATWVRNGVNGRADTALVARRNGEIAGFNLCMRYGDRAVIDLIAVDSVHRGQGLGRTLVAAALAFYAGRVSTMLVGTQENNTPSIALYRSMGFSPVSSSDTYHWTP